ncbi:MAG: hypothetical protein K0R80_3550, partial [Clostridia bacterium]|nr:hypothetical protein [Clostridia bacterium]
YRPNSRVSGRMEVFMKLSVSAWCLQEKLFNKEITIFDFINYCHENGVKYVELLDCFLNGDNDIKEINELLHRLDMEVSSYSIGNDFVLADSSKRKEQVEYMKESIGTALKLGTGNMRVFSGDKKDGMSFDEAEDWIVECFKQVTALAEEKVITMVLENHGLLAGKSRLVNENSLDAVKYLKENIEFIHLKDFKKVNDENGYIAIDGSIYQGVVLGDGDVPISEIINYLKEYGYEGYLSIEYEGLGDPFKGTAECINYAKHALE